MLKKLTAWILVLTLMAAFLPAAKAEGTSNLQEKIESQYRHALEASELPDLAGYCGELAGWQLYDQGINVAPFSRDGNAYFPMYSAMKESSGGYPITAYSAEDYTLLQALNKITSDGTRDAWDILVCFSSTNTEKGAEFGHVVYVYGILDGMVYFTESYTTTFLNQPGQMIKVPIREFARSYAGWTQFQGVIQFGIHDGTEDCIHYTADLFVEAETDTTLTEKIGEGEPVRTVKAGERLHVIGMFETQTQKYYYQVAEGSAVYYLPAKDAEFLLLNPDAVQYIPEMLKNGSPGGQICSRFTAMDWLQIIAPDYEQAEPYTREFMLETQCYNLDSQDLQQRLQDYPLGVEPEIRVRVKNYCLIDGVISCLQDEITPGQQVSIVSEVPQSRMMPEEPQEEPDEEQEKQDLFSLPRSGLLEMIARCPKSAPVLSAGTVGYPVEIPVEHEKPELNLPEDVGEAVWSYEDGIWSFGSNGTSRSGWLTWHGVSYYLDWAGRAVTGSQIIGSEICSFSPTGALLDREPI